MYVSKQHMTLTVPTLMKFIFLIDIIQTNYIPTFIQIDRLRGKNSSKPLNKVGL